MTASALRVPAPELDLESFNARILKFVKNDYPSLFDAGIEEAKRGDLTAAVGYLLKATTLSPDQPEVFHALGFLLALNGDPVAFVDAFRTAMELAPNDPSIRLSFVGSLIRSNRLSEAETVCRSAIQQIQSSAGLYAALAYILDQKNDAAGALLAANQAVSLEPENAARHYVSGLLYYRLGDLDASKKAYDTSLRLSPLLGEGSNAHEGLGLVFLRRGDIKSALIEFRLASAQAPNNSLFRTNLGYAYLQDGNIEKAQEAFLRVLEVAPNSPKAHAGLGAVFEWQSDYESALNKFKQALYCDPEDAFVQHGVGSMLAKVGKSAAAIRYLKKAIDLQPGIAAYHVTLGHCYVVNGRFPSAFNQYLRAYSLNPKSVDFAVIVDLWSELFPDIDNDEGVDLHEFDDDASLPEGNSISASDERLIKQLTRQLRKIFDARRVPETARAELITKFQLEIVRVTDRKPKLSLPEAAPKLYAKRPKGQGIVEFLRDPEGWGPYVKAGVLTRPDLLRLDRQAYRALYNLKGPLPADVELLTKSEALDRMVSRGEVEAPSLPRVGQTLERRRQRAAKRDM